MQNYSNDNTARRYIAHVSVLGTTQLQLRNPYVVAWWSVAYPGFGHFLLSKSLHGFMLFIWEVVVNVMANVNLAILYMLQGNFTASMEVVDTRWVLAYMPVYLFGIWHSYRTTVDMNKVYLLSEREAHRFNTFSIGPTEVNYLDKRNPVMALIWSLFIPGLGQLYMHRLLTGFFLLIWTVILLYLSNTFEAGVLLFSGNIEQATAVLKPKYFMFLPSIYGFAAYDAYANTVENNKLFEKEQKNFLTKQYQDPDFRIIKGQRV